MIKVKNTTEELGLYQGDEEYEVFEVFEPVDGKYLCWCCQRQTEHERGKCLICHEYDKRY